MSLISAGSISLDSTFKWLSKVVGVTRKKGVGKERERRGSGRCQTFTICLWPRQSMFLFFSLLILLSSLIWCISDRFRPRKAKSIGNILTNRQNVAHCCLHKVKEICWRIREGIRYTCAAPIYWRNDASCAYRQWVQICSVYNFQILFRWFFSVRRASPTNAGWFGASIGSARYKREKKYA